MQRAESYAALAPLLSAQLRRGVVTNCFLSAEDYQRELPRGLYYEEREGCLLLLRQRPKPRRQRKRQTRPLTRCGRFFLHSLTR